MKTSAYIIDARNHLVARVETALRGGAKVTYSALQNDSGFLINAAVGKISRAKKWENLCPEYETFIGEEITINGFTYDDAFHIL